MKKLTQAEFDAMTRDERGYLNIPAETDCTEVDFGGAGMIVFGDWCTLGNGCKLGDGCKLGEFVNVRTTFEGGRVKNGLYVQIGNIGSEHRTAYFFIDESGKLFVRAGCWFSGMDEFKQRVASVHGGTLYETQYMAACTYAEAVLPEMLKADDERRGKVSAE